MGNIKDKVGIIKDKVGNIKDKANHMELSNEETCGFRKHQKLKRKPIEYEDCMKKHCLSTRQAGELKKDYFEGTWVLHLELVADCPQSLVAQRHPSSCLPAFSKPTKPTHCSVLNRF